MKPSLLITGAGGFVGRRLLRKIDYSKYGTIYCITRKRENIPPSISHPNLKIIEGDLLSTESYESTLDKVDTVIHMAAITGKANPQDYFKVNAYATMLLLDRCKQPGSTVKNILFVSSIAVAFNNKKRYYYAQSKEQAEDYVKSGGLNFTILRPTMIMGKGSTVFEGLARLTSLPVIPVFGKGTARIQPVDVEDVVKAIIRIQENSRYHGEILELGGPEIISIESFMKQIPLVQGKKVPPAFHLPMGIIVFFLTILEHFVYGLLPLTVGQLASFRNEGIAEFNSLMKKMSPLMTNMESMIKNSLEPEEEHPADQQITDIPEQLKRECEVFSRYLVKQKPNSFIYKKYDECHRKLDFTPADFHDSILLKLASRTPLLTRTADAYSRFFRFNSTVRKKLAYLMAILEVTPPYFRYYDNADRIGLIGFIVRMGLKGITLAFHLLFSFIFLFPLQVLSKVAGKKKETGETNPSEPEGHQG
jgi:nucleoside-diphosphate-sugar epimerase